MYEDDFLPALAEVLSSGRGFGHRQHVQLAWQYLHLAEPGTAERVTAERVTAERWMRAAVRRVAAAHGTPEKYHETLTMVWVRLVAAHVRSSDAGSFEEFIAANQRLLDRQLPDRHYSTATMWTDCARRQWVEPDLLPLPGCCD